MPKLKEEICKFTGKELNCGRCDGAKRGFTQGFTMHCHMSISGPLFRNSKKEWKEMAEYVTSEDGKKLTPEEVKASFMELYHQGVEALKMCECDNFCNN
jgi:hypothetical protein